MINLQLHNQKEKWKFYREAYDGTGGFEDGSYLDRYIRESDERYKQRQEVAFYINLFKQKVEKFIGYLFKQKPLRTSKNSIVLNIFDDCDFKGNNINIFISNFAKNCKIRGVGVVAVEQLQANNYKTQLENRLYPYFLEILPETIKDYKIDNNGDFEFIAYETILDKSIYQNRDILKVTRYHEKKSTITYDGDTIIDKYDHNLGI